MRLIDADALYERACELEAQALAYVGKIANDETKIEEWRIWSAILAERTAFKHDIFDAPEVKTEPHWIPCSERLPEAEGCYITTARWKDNEPFYVCENEYGFKINEKWNGSDRIFDNGAAFGDMWGDEMDNLMEVIAWMPLPEPYKEGES